MSLERIQALRLEQEVAKHEDSKFWEQMISKVTTNPQLKNILLVDNDNSFASLLPKKEDPAPISSLTERQSPKKTEDQDERREIRLERSGAQFDSYCAN